MWSRQTGPTIARVTLRYYLALKLTAGAATLRLPFERQPAPMPIVRVTRDDVIAGFDPQELYAGANGDTGIVTLPQPRSIHVTERPFSPN